MSKTQTYYNEVVGRIGREYYVLNYVFTDGKHRGAVGAVFEPVSRAQHEEDTQPENQLDRFEELWQSAVASGNTTDNLADYVQGIIDYNGDSALYDLSYYDDGCKAADIYNSELPADHNEDDEAEFCECVGGGRCFTTDMKWDALYRSDLWELIKQAEQPPSEAA